jgi:hypothetical protein
MPTYYAFKGTLGRQRVTSDTALIVTDDRTGEKLPERRLGSWKFLRAITLMPKSGDRVIVSHDGAMAAIAKEGFYQVPSRGVDLEVRHFSLGKGQFIRSSGTPSRRYT